MSVIIGMLVNTFLVAIPVGTTTAALLALRPFDYLIPPPPPPFVDYNAIYINSTCGEFHDFALNKNGLNFTLNSNEILAANGSVLCSTIKTFQNSTYSYNTTAPELSVTWSYPFKIVNASVRANETQPTLHAYPKVDLVTGFAGSTLPVALTNLQRFGLDFKWTLGIGEDRAPSNSWLRLATQQTNTSVVLDMYMDANKTKAGDASAASFEILIYWVNVGLQHPVGFGTGNIIQTKTILGHDFQLFAGKNSINQNVFSWVAVNPVDEFHDDVSAFFDPIVNLGKLTPKGVDLPQSTYYIGSAGFGNQAFNSQGNITWYVPQLSMDIRHFTADS